MAADEDSEESVHVVFRRLLYARSQRLFRQIVEGRQLLDGDDLTASTCTTEDGYCLYRLRRGVTVFSRIYRPKKCEFTMGRSMLLVCVYMLRTTTTYFVVVQDRKKGGGYTMEFPVEFVLSEETHNSVLFLYKYNSPCLTVRDYTKKTRPVQWHYAGVILAMQKLNTPALGEILPVHNVNMVSSDVSVQETLNRIRNHFSNDEDVNVHLYTLSELQDRRICFNIDERRTIDHLSLDARGYVAVY